jgi:SAM-dependent methyltransferase
MIKQIKQLFNKHIDIDTELELEPINEIEISSEQREELEKAVADIDIGYLEYSSEAVGFNNREDQWNLYATVARFIEPGTSVLDFGCGRGDFKSFWLSAVGDDLEYTGIDMNQPLIEAGQRIYNDRYNDRKLILMDWFDLNDNEFQADWCINIGSCNLRYDADTVTDDIQYLQRTIETMYMHANKGVIITLTSSIQGTDDGLINHNPGDVLNWAQANFGRVALDHTMSRELFNLIIYK